MSKLRIGNYESGEPKFCYFRRKKHRPSKQFKAYKYWVWINKCRAIDASLIKKYGE